MYNTDQSCSFMSSTTSPLLGKHDRHEEKGKNRIKEKTVFGQTKIASSALELWKTLFIGTAAPIKHFYSSENIIQYALACTWLG